MPWIGAVIGGGLGLLGSSMQADASRDAADRAAAASEFKPYNIKSGLGSATFNKDKNTVDYTIDPRLREYQNTMFGMANSALPTEVDPNKAADNLYSLYQQKAAPEKERSFSMLQNSQFNNGTLGLATGGTTADAGGYAARNPALAAWLEAQNTADQNLYLKAQDTARNYLDSDIKRSQGLLGSGVGIENVGYDMVNLGATLGGRQSQANSSAAQILGAGYQNAANTQNNFIDSTMKGLTQTLGKVDFGSLLGRGSVNTNSPYYLGYGGNNGIGLSYGGGTGLTTPSSGGMFDLYSSY